MTFEGRPVQWRAVPAMPRRLALERCGADTCEYVAWVFTDGRTTVTVSFDGPPHSVLLWDSVAEAADHFEAHVDDEPDRHLPMSGYRSFTEQMDDTQGTGDGEA